jgi:hypothetical protein
MPAPREENWSAIAAQAAAGATLKDLSEHWNIPEGTLKARSAREGWKAMGREIQAQKTGVEVVPSHSRVQPRATDRAISLFAKVGTKSKLVLAKTVSRTASALYKQNPDELKRNTGSLRNTTAAWKDLHGASDAPASPLVNLNLVRVVLAVLGFRLSHVR